MGNDYETTSKEYLSVNLRIMMAIWKIDQRKFSELLGLESPTFNNYINKISFPRIPTLLAISDISGIPVDKLLRENIPVQIVPVYPLKEGETNPNLVNEARAVYKTNAPPLIEFSVLEQRLNAMEDRLKLIVERLNANDCQK